MQEVYTRVRDVEDVPKIDAVAMIIFDVFNKWKPLTFTVIFKMDIIFGPNFHQNRYSYWLSNSVDLNSWQSCKGQMDKVCSKAKLDDVSLN